VSVAPLLEVEGLTVVREGRLSRTILDGIGLRIDDGQTLGIVGESGSGKSVLLTAILGLLAPPWWVAAASVRLEGRELLGLGRACAGPHPGQGAGSGAC
jgi:ABC-type glutathione transport system ATPase component